MPGQTNGCMEGWKGAQTLFYRTLNATIRGPKTLSLGSEVAES